MYKYNIIENGEVTEDHILNGEKKDVWECPLALSVSEELGWDVRVEAEQLFLHLTNDWIIPSKSIPSEVYLLSAEIQSWMREFDLGWEVQPFEYEVLENFFIKMKGEVLANV